MLGTDQMRPGIEIGATAEIAKHPALPKRRGRSRGTLIDDRHVEPPRLKRERAIHADNSGSDDNDMLLIMLSQL